MNTTAYIPVPITQHPPEDGYYLVLELNEKESGRVLYFMEGDWYEDEHEARFNENHDAYDVDDCHWLRPVDLSSLLSLAWDAGIERFCFDNGSEFVEGKPKDKKDFINSILNPTK